MTNKRRDQIVKQALQSQQQQSLSPKFKKTSKIVATKPKQQIIIQNIKDTNLTDHDD